MGSLINLAAIEAPLPDLIIIDTNLIVARFLTSLHQPHPVQAERADQLFRALAASNAVGVVTFTAFSEAIHFAIRRRYTAEIASHRVQLAASYPNQRRYDWQDLYKIDSDILHGFGEWLERWRRTLTTHNLLFLQPGDLAPLPFGRSIEQELIRLVVRYGLDTNDAAILLEAQRAGVFSVASLDTDLRRAQADFDVYTWP